jgi:hypothetical protein
MNERRERVIQNTIDELKKSKREAAIKQITLLNKLLRQAVTLRSPMAFNEALLQGADLNAQINLENGHQGTITHLLAAQRGEYNPLKEMLHMIEVFMKNNPNYMWDVSAPLHGGVRRRTAIDMINRRMKITEDVIEMDYLFCVALLIVNTIVTSSYHIHTISEYVDFSGNLGSRLREMLLEYEKNKQIVFRF